MYICTYIHTCIHMCVCTLYIHTYVWTDCALWNGVHMYAYMYIHLYICIYLYIYKRIFTYSHVCMYAYMHMYTYKPTVPLHTELCAWNHMYTFFLFFYMYMYIYIYNGYCSTVQGLLDWFEGDLGFTRAFIYSNRFVCSDLRCYAHGIICIHATHCNTLQHTATHCNSVFWFTVLCAWNHMYTSINPYTHVHIYVHIHIYTPIHLYICTYVPTVTQDKVFGYRVARTHRMP